MRTDWAGSLRAAAPVLAVAIVVQAAAGWIGARAWLADHNTLLANGRWTATKTELERGLIGAFSFLHERQTLADGRLNLGAWHGFQEVVWKRDLEDLRLLEFDFELRRRGWIAALLDRHPEEETYTAVRFGGAVQSALLTVREDGRFLSTQPLSVHGLESGERHRARLELGGGRLTVSLNGKRVGDFEHAARQHQRFGFRGGLAATLVDDVAARFGDFGSVRESFDQPPGAGRLTALVVATAAAVNLALFLLLAAALRISGRELGFYFLMINLTLLVLGVLAYGVVAERGEWYPGLGRSLAEKETYFRRGESAKVERHVAERFAEIAGQARYRILFIGSSQTWGAGARRDEETFVAQLERLLNSGDGPPRFACINGGISATRARDLVPFLERWLEAGTPDMVIVNLASNDMSSRPERFDAAIRAMVDSSLAAGARPVLIKEPRVYPPPGLIARHRQLEAIAADYGIPALELLTYLRAARSSGFLWWDQVHLTSWGQTLVARRLHDDILAVIAGPWQPAYPAGAGAAPETAAGL